MRNNHNFFDFISLAKSFPFFLMVPENLPEMFDKIIFDTD